MANAKLRRKDDLISKLVEAQLRVSKLVKAQPDRPHWIRIRPVDRDMFQKGALRRVVNRSQLIRLPCEKNNPRYTAACFLEDYKAVSEAIASGETREPREKYPEKYAIAATKAIAYFANRLCSESGGRYA